MWDIDKDRRDLLLVKKSIRNMQIAIEQALEYVNTMEEKLFDEYELREIRRVK